MPDALFSPGVQRAIDEAARLSSIMIEMATSAVEKSPNRLSVGLKGDVPVFPPFAAAAIILTVLFLQLFVGRWRWVPWPVNAFFVRVAIFGSAVAVFLSTMRQCENEMTKTGTHLHFTAVKGLVTTGPFAVSRNPLYVAFTLLIPGFAVLVDSLLLLLASPILPMYLDRFVIPAEEKLLHSIFPDTYPQYVSTVPRWL